MMSSTVGQVAENMDRSWMRMRTIQIAMNRNLMKRKPMERTKERLKSRTGQKVMKLKMMNSIWILMITHWKKRVLEMMPWSRLMGISGAERETESGNTTYCFCLLPGTTRWLH